MKGFVAAETLARAGARLGIRVELEPEFRYAGRIVFPDGRIRYFRNTHFDLNGQGAAEIARDKAYAAYFLARLGYPVPEGQTFASPTMRRWSGAPRGAAEAAAYAARLGYPVFVKPNNGSQGRNVALVYDAPELAQALAAVFARDHVALVQRPVPGDDYRIVVLDDAVVCAYRRTPLAVAGDGAASVRELLRRKHAAYAASGRDTTIPLDDMRIARGLARRGLSLASVPAAGLRLVLMDNANLSTGGEATDATAGLHPAYRALAVRLAAGLGLRYCGVDILTPGRVEEAPGAYVVLEVNPAPGLDHFAHLGPAQAQIVETMYEAILRKLALDKLPGPTV